MKSNHQLSFSYGKKFQRYKFKKLQNEKRQHSVSQNWFPSHSFLASIRLNIIQVLSNTNIHKNILIYEYIHICVLVYNRIY